MSTVKLVEKISQRSVPKQFPRLEKTQTWALDFNRYLCLGLVKPEVGWWESWRPLNKLLALDKSGGILETKPSAMSAS